MLNIQGAIRLWNGYQLLPGNRHMRTTTTRVRIDIRRPSIMRGSVSTTTPRGDVILRCVRVLSNMMGVLLQMVPVMFMLVLAMHGTSVVPVLLVVVGLVVVVVLVLIVVATRTVIVLLWRVLVILTRVEAIFVLKVGARGVRKQVGEVIVRVVIVRGAVVRLLFQLVSSRHDPVCSFWAVRGERIRDSLGEEEVGEFVRITATSGFRIFATFNLRPTAATRIWD